MKYIVDLNQSSRSGGPSGGGDQWIEPQPDAIEYSGYAICLTKGQLASLVDVHSDTFQTMFPRAELTLLLYKVLGSAAGSEDDPRDCRVEMVGHVSGMSQIFQLKSGRQGFTVEVWRLTHPGQGATDISSVQGGEAQSHTFNVMMEDFSSMNEVVSIFRPAYDVTVDGAFSEGGLNTKWVVDASLVTPSSRATGKVSWYTISSEGVESLEQTNAVWRFAKGGVSLGAEAWDPEHQACYIQEDGMAVGAKIGIASFSEPIAVLPDQGVLCWSGGFLTVFVEGGVTMIEAMPGIIRADTNRRVNPSDTCFIQIGPVEM